VGCIRIHAGVRDGETKKKGMRRGGEKTNEKEKTLGEWGGKKKGSKRLGKKVSEHRDEVKGRGRTKCSLVYTKPPWKKAGKKVGSAGGGKTVLKCKANFLAETREQKKGATRLSGQEAGIAEKISRREGESKKGEGPWKEHQKTVHHKRMGFSPYLGDDGRSYRFQS